MRYNYRRFDNAGPGEDEQDVIIRAGRLHASDPRRIFTDGPQPHDLAAREALIAGLNPGDQIVVSSIDRLGVGKSDILKSLLSIAEKGASVFEAETGEEVECSRDALLTGAAVERAISRLAAARKSMDGPRPRRRWTKVELDAAKPVFEDPSLTSKQKQEKTGIPYRTLFTHFRGKTSAVEAGGEPVAPKRRGRRAASA